MNWLISMRKIIVFPYVVTFVLIALYGCSEFNEELINPPIDKNLISNSSFEINGAPSLQGWVKSSNDTSYINFSIDVPPDGGNYSVRLRNEWSFPGSIRYFIVPETGTNQYLLSVWGKVLPHTPAHLAGGDVSLFHINAGNWTLRKYLYFSDTTWTRDTLLDTLSTTSSDTLAIILQGNIDQFSYGYILFDLCKFEKLD